MLDIGKPVFSWAKQLKQEEQGDHRGSGDCRDRQGTSSDSLDCDCTGKGNAALDRAARGGSTRGGPHKKDHQISSSCACCSHFVPRWNCKELWGFIGFPCTSSSGNGFWLLFAAWPSQLPLNMGRHMLLEDPHTSAWFCFCWLPTLLWGRLFWDPVSLSVYSSPTPNHFSTPSGPSLSMVCLPWAPCPSCTLWEKGSLQ